jgi:hypothetical protein
MQGASGGLAAQFVGEPVAEVQAPVPTEAAARAGWLGGHQLLGEQRLQDFLVITFCAAFSLIGWLMIAQGVEQVRATRALTQWPVAYGVIETTEVYPVEGSQGARWRPQVTYSYAVGGRVITATRLSLGKAPLEPRREGAERFLAQYRPGSPVIVFFNPRELTESVLDVSTPPSVYVNLAFGAALALVGPALLALFGFWPRHRAAMPPRDAGA